MQRQKTFPFFKTSRLWNPPNLLFNGYWQLFHQEQSGWGIALSTHPHLMLRLRKYGAVTPVPQPLAIGFYVYYNALQFRMTVIGLSL
jgi:hypothetical protein